MPLKPPDPSAGGDQSREKNYVEEMMRAHQPVALERCIALLTPSIERNHNPIVVDATLGLGGHSGELLSRFPNLRIEIGRAHV